MSENTMKARTQDEIAAKVAEKQGAFLSFWPDTLLDFLDYDHAKPFLKDEATPETWESDMGNFAGYGPPTNRCRPVSPDDRDFIIESMRHYMAFGWEKVEDQRGLSANRTVDRMCAWLWLLGDDDLLGDIEGERIRYAPYGAPILRAVCERYGFAIPAGQ